MKLYLSKVLPVRMKSTYNVITGNKMCRKHSTWWQWRGHIFFHKVEVVSTKHV